MKNVIAVPRLVWERWKSPKETEIPVVDPTELSTMNEIVASMDEFEDHRVVMDVLSGEKFEVRIETCDDRRFVSISDHGGSLDEGSFLESPERRYRMTDLDPKVVFRA